MVDYFDFVVCRPEKSNEPWTQVHGYFEGKNTDIINNKKILSKDNIVKNEFSKCEKVSFKRPYAAKYSCQRDPNTDIYQPYFGIF